MKPSPDICYRWFHPIHLLFVPIFLVFPVFGVFLYFGSQKIAVPTLLWVAWGCSGLVSYWLLGLFVNRSTVTLEDKRVRVRTGPLPWPSKNFDVSDKDRFDSATARRGTSSTMHHLLLRSADGSSRRVLQAPSLDRAKEWAELLNQRIGRAKDPAPTESE